jgi:hypothetical protein
MRTRMPGRKIATRPSAARASPCGDGVTTAPRYAANVKRGRPQEDWSLAREDDKERRLVLAACASAPSLSIAMIKEGQIDDKGR